MNEICGAYALIEIHSGKCYIGSSSKINRRLNRHDRDLRHNEHHCLSLQELWNDGAVFEIWTLPCSSREEAYFVEQTKINWYLEHKPELLLNIGTGVKGGDNLTRNPNRDDIVSRMTDGATVRYANMSPEEREKMSERMRGENNGMFGKTHTAEARSIMSSVNIGNQHALGAVRSQEQRLRLSEFAKTRTGENNPFHGRSHSEETRKMLSEKQKAKYEAGLLNPNSRKVEVNGVVYGSLTDAATKLGISPALMVHRIKNNHKEKYAGYRYVS